MKRVNIQNVLAGLGVASILIVAFFVAFQAYAIKNSNSTNSSTQQIVEDDLAPW